MTIIQGVLPVLMAKRSFLKVEKNIDNISYRLLMFFTTLIIINIWMRITRMYYYYSLPIITKLS